MLPDLNQLILDQIPGCVGWKDLSLKYLGANKNLLEAKQCQYIDELIGLTDEDLNTDDLPINQEFHHQDLKAMQGHSIEVIHSLKNGTFENVYLLKKTALRNQDNKIAGVIYLCTPWDRLELWTILKNIDKRIDDKQERCYHLNIPIASVSLSEREIECLFFLIRGKTAKQIASILYLSKRTVESYLDHIKNKLGCTNKSELLVKAVTQGYHTILPKSLLNKNISAILKEESTV